MTQPYSPQALSSNSPGTRASGRPEGFITSSAVNSLIHKGFACPLISCGRLFKRLEHLKRHVRPHTQDRPYECTRCSKRFSRSDNLTQHIKTHEKADLGERMRTEMSESTEDEGSYLDTDVDRCGLRMWSEGQGLPAGNMSLPHSDIIPMLPEREAILGISQSVKFVGPADHPLEHSNGLNDDVAPDQPLTQRRSVIDPRYPNCRRYPDHQPPCLATRAPRN